jgi:hypothetical protein
MSVAVNRTHGLAIPSGAGAVEACTEATAFTRRRKSGGVERVGS